MNEERISVLLMDDEPMSEIVQVAVDWMKGEGFEVDLVESRSQTIQSYYDKFYDVFVLDIDMSHIPEDEEGDGVNVLKRFISLHNGTQVIMFSGAGTVPHWFAAANAHCFAYVHKNEEDSVPKLIEWIRKSKKADIAESKPLKKKCPSRILIYNRNIKYQKPIENAIAKNLGDSWVIEICADLSEVYEKLQNSANYGIVLLFQDIFELRSKEKDQLKFILSKSPAPQVIVGCLGKDEYQYSILFLANQHPFRMINTENHNWSDHLEDALIKAVKWYGQREIFPADPEALKRMHVTLPSDAIEKWEFTPENLEEMVDDFRDDQEEK